ncbi:MAG: hypothetical protein ACTSPO_15490 [Candidatus Heimdallarchaeaceae archaeon]
MNTITELSKIASFIPMSHIIKMLKDAINSYEKKSSEENLQWMIFCAQNLILKDMISKKGRDKTFNDIDILSNMIEMIYENRGDEN